MPPSLRQGSSRAIDDQAAIRGEGVARQELRILAREEQDDGRNVFLRSSIPEMMKSPSR